MKATVVAKTKGGVIVQAGEEDKDRYMTDSPFWIVVGADSEITGEVGSTVEFARKDVLACSSTLDEARRLFTPG